MPKNVYIEQVTAEPRWLPAASPELTPLLGLASVTGCELTPCVA